MKYGRYGSQITASTCDVELYRPACGNLFATGCVPCQCWCLENQMGFTAVTSFIQPRQYITEGAVAASRSELAARPTVRLTHCWDEGGVQIAEQLTVLCDLIQPCSGCFIRCGVSLPRCAVMNCPSLRSRWSQTNAAGLAFHAKASARIGEPAAP